MTPRTFGVGRSRAPRVGGHPGGLRREYQGDVASPRASRDCISPPNRGGHGPWANQEARSLGIYGHLPGKGLAANRLMQAPRSAPTTTFSGVVKALEHIQASLSRVCRHKHEPLPSVSPISTDSHRFLPIFRTFLGDFNLQLRPYQ